MKIHRHFTLAVAKYANRCCPVHWHGPLFMLVLGMLFLGQACQDIDDLSDAEFTGIDAEYAFPVFHGSIGIVEVTENTNSNASISVDSDQRVTVLYNGDLVRRTALQVFPPAPFFNDLPILDTEFELTLPFNNSSLVLKRAIFNLTSIAFKFETSVTEDLDVTVTLPEISKDGDIFQVNFVVPFTGSTSPRFESDRYDLTGWELKTETNSIFVRYDARNQSGEQVEVDSAFMHIDVVNFSYIEGFFGMEVFDIQGDIIPVGIFDSWQSGGISFVDPKVTITLENAFGFPVRSKVNQLEIVTIEDDTHLLESAFIDEGIDFAFPALDEVGTVKHTDFAFDRDNSNIHIIFNQRTKQLRYDIDAIANAEDNPEIIGFITDSSYFLVKVAVELPMLGTVSDLVLADTFDIDLNIAEEIRAAEFKLISQNEFPVDVDLQAYFVDGNGAIIDSLFEDSGLRLEAAQLQPDGSTIPIDERTQFIEVAEDRANRLRSATRMAVETKMTTEGQNNDEDIWIRDDFRVHMRMGAKIQVRR